MGRFQGDALKVIEPKGEIMYSENTNTKHHFTSQSNGIPRGDCFRVFKAISSDDLP